jgi:hypothetical protein
VGKASGMLINGHTRTHNLLITGLGKQKIILGYPWFKQANPDINWKERNGETNRTKRHGNLRLLSKRRLIQKIGKIILSIRLKN